MITVRTLNGSAYHGELIERVANEHVVLKLETGDVNRGSDLNRNGEGFFWRYETSQQPTTHTLSTTTKRAP